MADHNKELNEALDACLQGIESEGWSIGECLSRYPAYQHELAPLLQTAAQVARVRDVKPRIGYSRQGWAALRTRMRQAKAPRPLSWFRVPRRMATAVAATITVLILAATTGGTLYAASYALPGEPLYAVEIAYEQAQLRLTPPLKGLRLRLDLADRRVWEAERLAGQGRLGVLEPLAGYNQLVSDISLMIGSGTAANDRALLETFRTALADQQARLEALRDQLPESARPAVERAIEAAISGQEQIQQALDRQ
jgi:hypothetical protein